MFLIIFNFLSSYSVLPRVIIFIFSLSSFFLLSSPYCLPLVIIYCSFIFIDFFLFLSLFALHSYFYYSKHIFLTFLFFHISFSFLSLFLTPSSSTNHLSSSFLSFLLTPVHIMLSFIPLSFLLPSSLPTSFIFIFCIPFLSSYHYFSHTIILHHFP